MTPSNRRHVEWPVDEPPHRIPYGPNCDEQRERLAALLARAAEAAGVEVVAEANGPQYLNSGAANIPRSDGVTLIRLPPSMKVARRSARHIAECEVLHHTCQIIAAARLHDDWHTAWSRGMRLPRRASDQVCVRFAESMMPSARQLSSLQAAVENGKELRLEFRWRQMTPAARAILQLATEQHLASNRQRQDHRKRPSLHDFQAGALVSSPLPSRALLREVVPIGVTFAKRHRSRRNDHKDALLDTCRNAFLAVTLGTDDQLTRGRSDVPDGAGADFMQHVEDILGVRFLSEGSRHMIKRVRAAAKARTGK